MPKSVITFGVINKRLTSKNSNTKTNITNESNAIEKAYRIITSKLENKQTLNLSIIKNNMERLLESLADSNTANRFSLYPISIIEQINNTQNNSLIEYADQIAKRYSDNVLPYIENMNTVIEAASDYNLSDKQKNTIVKEATTYSACDRIISNYNTIKKRFNIEDTVLRNKSNLKLATEAVCSMVDTYDRESYQKMNICIEEILFIVEKNNINCNKADIINTIVEYFLLSSPELTERNYKGYKKCITESCFISEEDISQVKYLFNQRDTDNGQASNIRQYIEDFYMSPEKTRESFKDTVDRCINSDLIDFTYNFEAILEFILSVFKAENMLSDTDLHEAMEEIENIIVTRIINLVNDAELTQEVLTNLLNSIVDIAQRAYNDSIAYSRTLYLSNHLKDVLSKLAPYIDFLYDSDNIATIEMINNAPEISIKEGHIFRGHNLLVAIRNLDRYLGNKCKEFTNKLIGKKAKPTDKPSLREKISGFLFTDEDKWLSKKLKKGAKNFDKAMDVLSAITCSFDTSNFNAYSYITEESKMFDMILANIPYTDDNIEDVQDTMASVCKEFNTILENNYDLSSFRLYYLINPGEASLHFTEAHKFTLDEESITKINEAKHPDFDHCLDLLAEAEATANWVDTINNKDLESSLFSYFSSGKSMSIEKFDTILEALSILEINKSVVKKFADKYKNNIYYTITEEAESEKETSTIDKLLNTYEFEDSYTDEVKLEAYMYLDSLLESDDEDYEDFDYDEEEDEEEPQKNNQNTDDQPESKESKDDIKKNPYKGINLKSIKLALIGLKKKFRNLSQKEQELAKGVDSSFKHLVDSFRNAMISDSRESIIKGSVVPSFSKCLKIGIPAAVGISSGLINPGVAAIAALGSFAVSKRLTNKERMIILDEIETELEVVEREIQMAEREEDMKKFRALLQYKKNLQRQYQRIKYNVKLGRIASSKAGAPGDSDNGGY